VNGVFDGETASYEEIIAAITGVVPNRAGGAR